MVVVILPRLGFRPGARRGRLRLFDQALQEFSISVPLGDPLLAFPMKSGFVTVDSGHDELL